MIGEAWNVLSDAEKARYKELGELYSSGKVPIPFVNSKKDGEAPSATVVINNPETQQPAPAVEIEFGA